MASMNRLPYLASLLSPTPLTARNCASVMGRRRAMSRSVRSLNTMYGGRLFSRAMDRRSSRSFWNNVSFSSSGAYEPNAGPSDAADFELESVRDVTPVPAPAALRSTRLISYRNSGATVSAARCPKPTIGSRPSAMERNPSVAIWLSTSRIRASGASCRRP